MGPIVNWNYIFWCGTFAFALWWIITIAVGLITKSLKAMTISMWIGLTAQIWFQAGWTIYGYSLYNSPENDCPFSPASAGWNTAMIVCMVFGSFALCYAPCLLCLVPAALKAIPNDF